MMSYIWKLKSETNPFLISKLLLILLGKLWLTHPLPLSDFKVFFLVYPMIQISECWINSTQFVLHLVWKARRCCCYRLSQKRWRRLRPRRRRGHPFPVSLPLCVAATQQPHPLLWSFPCSSRSLSRLFGVKITVKMKATCAIYTQISSFQWKLDLNFLNNLKELILSPKQGRRDK